MKRGLTRSQGKFGFIRQMALALTFSVSLPALLPAQTAQAYRQQATELARAKSWDAAIAAYRKALELEPNDPLTHYDLALTLKYKGEPAQAVEEFETALKLKPDFADAHYGLGATLYELHQPDAAMKELLAAVQLDPSNAGAHRLLAHLYSEKNDLADAETQLKLAVALKPSAEMHLELGMIEGQLGKLDLAAA